MGREHHTALSYCIDFVSKKEPKFFEAAVVLVTKYKANPNYAGKFANRTLLHCAAAQGKLDLVKQLVEVNKAALRVYDNEGRTPIKYAMEHKHDDVSEYLQQRLDLDNTSCCIVIDMVISIGLGYMMEMLLVLFDFCCFFCVAWFFFFFILCLCLIIHFFELFNLKK